MQGVCVNISENFRIENSTDCASKVIPVFLRASAMPATKRQMGSPAVGSPDLYAAGGGVTYQAGGIAHPIAQINPAHSRTTPVSATVSFLPCPERALVGQTDGCLCR